MKKRTAIGILAHVDSGKTTLSECMLYLTGAIRKLGRVDRGDTFLDTHSIERERGITVFSKQAELELESTHVTLLDTPGHADFSAETERVLRVLDSAVLVISASDGVQSHTETLWQLLESYGVPTFIFVNKTDLAESSRETIMTEIRTRLNDACIDFTESDNDTLSENIAVCDENLTEYYLENGTVPDNMIADAVDSRRIFPCFFGSALKCEGVSELLSGIDRYTPIKHYGNDFAARVFKITSDSRGERLTHIKIIGGSLNVREQLRGVCRDGSEWSEKITGIRIYSGEKFDSVPSVGAGEVCTVTGLTKTYSGQGLGSAAVGGSELLEPVLNYRAEIISGGDVRTALGNLRRLEEEDPQLHVIWNEQLGEIHVRLMGEIQREILERLMLERFGMTVNFVEGSIVYKETISEIAEGVGHYEPLRHYAEVHLKLEPLPRGSGIKTESRCSEEILDKASQALVLTHLREKQHIGVLTGSPITDIKITLISGRAHQKHTEGGDFRQATYRAVRQGLKYAESVLLEPWYSFRLELPTECIGRAMTDLQQMGGEFSQPETLGELSCLSGSVPASEIRGYHNIMIEYTHGKGRLQCALKEYAPCHNAADVIKKIGYDFERDTENTADSVFCSHGAGFTVKWNEVYDFMHIDRVLAEKNVPAPISKVRVREFVDSLASDSELMKIFERTYGPIKRREYDAMRTVKVPTSSSAPTQKNHRKTAVKNGTEYILVDGYNIIFAWEHLKRLADENLDLARATLINTLCNYRGYKQCEIIIVFDAYRVKGGRECVEEHGGVSVVYTKEAETADSYIERTSHRLSRENSVRVATSDIPEQLIILGNGALRISADTFWAEVQAVENAIREYLGS